MKKDEIVSIPFVAHESSMNRMERANKRLTILAVIEAIIIVIMFVGIMIYFYLPTEVEETTESNQDVTDIKDSQVHQKIGE